MGLRAYGLIVAMWVRATMTYRASFLLATVGNATITLLDFVAVLIMFSHVDTLGGFTVGEVGLLYGTSGLALSTAHLVLGQTDQVGSRIRDGSLDTMFVRPVPIFVQLAADRFALRRVGRALQGLGVLLWSLTQVDVDWSVWRVGLLVSMVVSGAVIFGAIFTFGAVFQFWAQDAAEVQHSFTYGGNALVVPANVTLATLPPYSPELNPVERLWRHLRGRYLSNRVYRDYDELLVEATAAYDRLDADTIKSVCGCPWLERAIQA